jgi:hypothetical protein
MTLEHAYDLVWDRGRSLDPRPTTCTVSFTRAGDRKLAAEFAEHLPALGGFELPAEGGRAFVVCLGLVHDLDEAH